MTASRAYYGPPLIHEEAPGQVTADRVADLNESFRADVDQWMEARAAAGDLPDLPRDVLILAVLGPARRFAELWLGGRIQTPISEAAQVLADVAWRGLAGRIPQAARRQRRARR